MNTIEQYFRHYLTDTDEAGRVRTEHVITAQLVEVSDTNDRVVITISPRGYEGQQVQFTIQGDDVMPMAQEQRAVAVPTEGGSVGRATLGGAA